MFLSFPISVCEPSESSVGCLQMIRRFAQVSPKLSLEGRVKILKLEHYIPRSEHASVKVFSMTGRKIETLFEGVVPAGGHYLNWKATGLASGNYLCRMQAADYSGMRKMVCEK